MLSHILEIQLFDTPHRIASVSKSATTTDMNMLVSQHSKQIDFDEVTALQRFNMKGFVTDRGI